MKETGMIFNSDMVRAILEDRKTQTRRPIKSIHSQVYPYVNEYPYGEEGDRWGIIEKLPLVRFLKNTTPFLWRFIWKYFVVEWVDITGIKVDELHGISVEDAFKEGIETIESQGGCKNYFHSDSGKLYATERDAFIALWNSIYGKTKFSWDKNPWVWVIEFRRVSR